MIEYPQMDTNTLFEGELTMKLKGRVLALTMAFMLIITSMSGFALAESVSVEVRASTDSDGRTTVSARFKGFSAGTENATTTLEGDSLASGHNALNVEADGTAVFGPKTLDLPAGKYAIKAYIDGVECGSASFEVTGSGSEGSDSSGSEGEETPEEGAEPTDEGTNEGTNEGDSIPDPANGIMLMSTGEGTDTYDPKLTTETRVSDGNLLIRATITGLPETVAVINTSIENGTGGERHMDVKTENGTFQTVFTANSVTPGQYQVTAQIKYTDAEQKDPDVSLSEAAEFLPAAPSITSGDSYTDGSDYTLTWTDDATYADGTSIRYAVGYWGTPEGETEEDWILLDTVSEKQYTLSADDLAQYGKRYAVRAVATVGDADIAGGFDEIELTAVPANVVITVPDVQQENADGRATVKATLSIPEGAEINNVWLKNDDLSVNQEVSRSGENPAEYSFTGSLNASDAYYIEAWINGVKFTQTFKISAFVPEVTVQIAATAFGEAITATFENLPESATQVCINVKNADGSHKQHFSIAEGAQPVPSTFTTNDAAINALLKTPGEYTITVSYEDGGEWYYPETENDIAVDVPLASLKVTSENTYSLDKEYVLEWTWKDSAPQYADGVEITYAIGALKEEGADKTDDANWDKVASDLTETSYTIPASYFETTGTHTFGVRAMYGGMMSEIATITLSNEGSPRFVKAPETTLYPDAEGKYTVSAEIEGLPASTEISMYADETEIGKATSSETGTAAFESSALANASASSVVLTFKMNGETIEGLEATVQLMPGTPVITSGTEIEHTAQKDLTITWKAVSGATDYIVKIDGAAQQYPTATRATIPGNYFEDGKSYAVTIEARKGSGETALVGKPATVNVAVGTQPLSEGTFTVEEALLGSNNSAKVRISATNLDPRVDTITIRRGADAQTYTDLTQPMEFSFQATSTEIVLVIEQKDSESGLTRQSQLNVALIIESSLPRFDLSANEVSMSVEGAKFNLTVYNLPEDAQRLAVKVGEEKIDTIQVTDALRDANGNITLEIGGTAYPFKVLSKPGEYSVRVTYQDGAGDWPQIGEIASLTVKPATPVLSSSEDTISAGDGYILTFTDDVKNEYGVTYEYAFQDEAGAYGAWTQTAEKTVTIPADSLPDAETFTIGVRAQSGGVYSDIATVRVSTKALSMTIEPEVIAFTGKDQTVTVTLKGIGQAHRGETAGLYFNGSTTAMTTETISDTGTVTLVLKTAAGYGMHTLEVRVGDTVLATGSITVGPAAPAIVTADPLNIATPTNVSVMFTPVSGADGYRLQMTGGDKTYVTTTPASPTLTTMLIYSSNFAANTTYTVALSAYITIDNVKVYGPAETMTIIVGAGGGSEDPDTGEMVSGDYKYTITGTTATITGYTGTASNITLPTNLGGRVVTAIGDGAFQNNATVTSVTIPACISSIGANAFEGSELLQVNGMQGVTSMGAYAFANTDLTAFTIPSGLVGLPEGALMNTRITGIIIPTSLVSIGAKAFSGCTQLANYVGAAGKGTGYRLTSIGSGAFNGCTKLTSLYIPSSVTSISSDFVDGCTNLAAFEVHGSNPNFLDFDGVLFTRSYSTTLLRFPPAKNISELKLSTINDETPATIVAIASGAFANSRYLKSVTLPSTITSISANAFLNSSITSISIPTSVTSIGTGAFQGSSLASVIIPSSVKTISNRAFQSCKNLTSVTINSGATHINPYAFYNCTSLTKVSIPTTVTYIGDYAFANCSSLEEISIPDSVTTIATGAFSGANQNLRIHCVENSAAYVYAKENGINVYVEAFVPRLSTDLLTNQSLLATYRAGAGGTFNLSSNTNWTIDTTDAWLTVYNRTTDPTGASAARTISGTGNASIGIMVTQNTGTTARQSSLKILWKDANNLQQLITVNVYQEPRSEALDSQIVVNAGAPYRQVEESGIEYLYNIPAGTTAQTLMGNLNDGLGRFQVNDRNGASVAATAAIATGYTITMLDVNGNEVETATLSIAGDVNRDGRISVSDINLTIDVFLKTEVVRHEQWLAANVNNDDRLSVSDVNAIIDLYLG